MHSIVHNTERHRIWHLHEMDNYTSWYSVWRLFSARCAFVALSAPCGVRVRHPLVFSGTHNCTLSCSVIPKNCTLSCSVCFFFRFFSFCRPHTRGPSKREKKECPKELIEIMARVLCERSFYRTRVACTHAKWIHALNALTAAIHDRSFLWVTEISKKPCAQAQDLWLVYLINNMRLYIADKFGTVSALCFYTKFKLGNEIATS